MSRGAEALNFLLGKEGRKEERRKNGPPGAGMNKAANATADEKRRGRERGAYLHAIYHLIFLRKKCHFCTQSFMKYPGSLILSITLRPNVFGFGGPSKWQVLSSHFVTPPSPK